MKLGVKCSVHRSQLYERMNRKPDLIELHLEESDLFGPKREELENVIEMLQTVGHEVYLHHPIKHNGEYLDILHEEEDHRLFYQLSTRILVEICKKHKIRCVIHPHYSQSRYSSVITKENTRRTRELIEQILIFGRGVLLWENACYGVFSSENPDWISDIVRPLNLKIAYDISHGFIGMRGCNDTLQQQLADLYDQTEYYHVVDSKGEKHDGLELGKGNIEWDALVSLIVGRPYIYEVTLQSHLNSIEMIRSHHYLKTLHHLSKIKQPTPA